MITQTDLRKVANQFGANGNEVDSRIADALNQIANEVDAREEAEAEFFRSVDDEFERDKT